MEKCPICQTGLLIRDTRKVKYRYHEREIEVDQPGDYCDQCGESILNGEDLRATEEVLTQFKREF